MVGGQKRTLPVDLDEVLLGGPCGQRFRTAAAVVVARLRERGEPRAQERQDFIALEVVRLCERDAELDRVVEHRQFAPHPFVDGCAAGIRQRMVDLAANTFRYITTTNPMEMQMLTDEP